MTEIERIESQVRSKLAVLRKCETDIFKVVLTRQIKGLMQQRKKLRAGEAQAERR
jgi:hypothetical protein